MFFFSLMNISINTGIYLYIYIGIGVQKCWRNRECVHQGTFVYVICGQYNVYAIFVWLQTLAVHYTTQQYTIYTIYTYIYMYIYILYTLCCSSSSVWWINCHQNLSTIQAFYWVIELSIIKIYIFSLLSSSSSSSSSLSY